MLSALKFNVAQHFGNLLVPYITTVFSSVAQLCPTLCNPMNYSTPGLPVHHQLSEFTQTQKDNADSGVQFITPAGPRQILLLAKDPDQHL